MSIRMASTYSETTLIFIVYNQMSTEIQFELCDWETIRSTKAEATVSMKNLVWWLERILNESKIFLSHLHLECSTCRSLGFPACESNILFVKPTVQLLHVRGSHFEWANKTQKTIRTGKQIQWKRDIRQGRILRQDRMPLEIPPLGSDGVPSWCLYIWKSWRWFSGCMRLLPVC